MNIKKHDVFEVIIEDMSESGEGVGNWMVISGLLKMP